MKQALKEPRLRLRIANSRGRRPVINEINKAHKLINNLLVEVNDCPGRDFLEQVNTLLWEVLCDNETK